MKKTYVAAIAIVAAVAIVLAAAVATVQYQSPSQSGSGNLSIMGVDPPEASQGVSHAMMHYSSVQAHKAGSSMSSGWVQVSGSGSMDLMASGTAQVLAASKVKAASYDAFRFNVDSIDVVYNNRTYAAVVASSTVTATSRSAVSVNDSSSASALVDVRTVIQNTATSTNPQFVFSATAVATSVPSQATASVSLQVGVTVDLSTQAWYSTFQAETSASVNVVAATLSRDSLTLSLQNTGDASGQIQEIIITPVSASTSLTSVISIALPASFNGSAIFTVSGSGVVQQTSSIQASMLTSAGTTVSSGSSSTISYTGNISMSGTTQTNGVVSGQQYLVTVIGSNVYASTTVVAS
ncbi:MAG: hypothetical protein JRN27_01205 [Nitrososphaerota archaeon]|nr:hypothetical protein [Nitrososphaerota archaeon]MDG6974700.1 hypothetical protein [Nitrososphaerota archaeon]MDG7009957.1 hypothetical protein [Nitrososphaerota archaeon]MDG7019042.1 hypothetical protein [Nitrososphaerota archaeon]